MLTALGLTNDVRSAPPVISLSRTSPLVLSWPTNWPSFALETRTNASPASPWAICSLQPAIVGTNYVVTNTLTESLRFFRLSNWPQMRCRYNLAHIGVAMRVWAMDNQDCFPFHVRTNCGGTLELRALGPDGFDTNAYLHFMVLSNELGQVSELVCPGDLLHTPAESFEGLSPTQVTYRLRTGDEVSDVNPTEVLAVCPVDGNTLYCDGAVTTGVTY